MSAWLGQLLASKEVWNALQKAFAALMAAAMLAIVTVGGSELLDLHREFLTSVKDSAAESAGATVKQTDIMKDQTKILGDIHNDQQQFAEEQMAAQKQTTEMITKQTEILLESINANKKK